MFLKALEHTLFVCECVCSQQILLTTILVVKIYSRMLSINRLVFELDVVFFFFFFFIIVSSSTYFPIFQQTIENNGKENAVTFAVDIMNRRLRK